MHRRILEYFGSRYRSNRAIEQSRSAVAHNFYSISRSIPESRQMFPPIVLAQNAARCVSADTRVRVNRCILVRRNWFAVGGGVDVVVFKENGKADRARAVPHHFPRPLARRDDFIAREIDRCTRGRIVTESLRITSG